MGLYRVLWGPKPNPLLSQNPQFHLKIPKIPPNIPQFHPKNSPGSPTPPPQTPNPTLKKPKLHQFPQTLKPPQFYPQNPISLPMGQCWILGAKNPPKRGPGRRAKNHHFPTKPQNPKAAEMGPKSGDGAIYSLLQVEKKKKPKFGSSFAKKLKKKQNKTKQPKNANFGVFFLCKNGDFLQKSATSVQAEGTSAPKSAVFWPNFTLFNTFFWGGGGGEGGSWSRMGAGNSSPIAPNWQNFTQFFGGWESGTRHFFVAMEILGHLGAFWGLGLTQKIPSGSSGEQNQPQNCPK